MRVGSAVNEALMEKRMRLALSGIVIIAGLAACSDPVGLQTATGRPLLSTIVGGTAPASTALSTSDTSASCVTVQSGDASQVSATGTYTVAYGGVSSSCPTSPPDTTTTASGSLRLTFP